jgi:hypothetical protein
MENNMTRIVSKYEYSDYTDIIIQKLIPEINIYIRNLNYEIKYLDKTEYIYEGAGYMNIYFILSNKTNNKKFIKLCYNIYIYYNICNRIQIDILSKELIYKNRIIKTDADKQNIDKYFYNYKTNTRTLYYKKNRLAYINYYKNKIIVNYNNDQTIYIRFKNIIKIYFYHFSKLFMIHYIYITRKNQHNDIFEITLNKDFNKRKIIHIYYEDNNIYYKYMGPRMPSRAPSVANNIYKLLYI